MTPTQQHTTHYRTCHLCEAMCGLAIEVRDNRVQRIAGDTEDVYSKGHLCPKALALQDIHEDPDRLRTPIIRRGDRWEAIGWEEALDLAAEKIHQIQETHGQDAFAIYTGNPTVHNTGTMLYLYDLFHTLGSRNRYASHSLDQLPQMLVSGALYGHQALFPVPDLHRTDFFLVLGANPMVSNGSIMATPDFKGIIRTMQDRGGRMVVIDPRRTRTAKAADHYLPIRPGTDVYLLAAMLHQVFQENRVSLGKAEAYVDGIEALRTAVAHFTPERASRQTGIAAVEICQLTRDFCEAERAIIYGRLGVSTQRYGTLCHWLIQCLNIVTGRLDQPGGLLFTKPAIDFLRLLKREAKSHRWASRVRDLPEVAGDLPTATLIDEMGTEGPGQVRGLLTIAGNPVLSAPGGHKLEEQLTELDFMISIDIFLNETTRHADLILPPAAGLEVVHYDFVLAIIALRNVANFSAPVLPKSPGSRYDHEILMGLQERLVRKRGSVPERLKTGILKRIPLERRIDLALRLGPYGVWGGRFLRKQGLSLKKLKQQPHGIDLGALKPSLPHRLFTPDKRIHLAQEDWIKALSQIRDERPDNRLLLIGRRHLLSNNSWMHNASRLMKQKDRCTALVHPDEGNKRQLREGQQVRLRGKHGEIQLAVQFSHDVMPGVVCVPHGWGHDGNGTQLRVANTQPGVNVNRLTDYQLTDGPSGNAVFTGIPVDIEPIITNT